MSTDTTEATAEAPAEKVMPRLKTRYREEILPALQSEFEIKNVMQVPGLTKIVV
ncbi:MAG: 50S ribosomal protein L5, partial [Nocardioides sp.]